MRARTLARKLALSLGLPLALSVGVACKKSEPERERPARPVASADHEATCEHGTFCVAKPSGSIELSAPPPFDACSVITPVPPGVPAGWPDPRRAKLRIRFSDTTTAEARGTDPGACCYEWREHCAGRPLREDGRAIVARAVTRGEGWAARGRERRLRGDDRRAREGAAAHWLENALMEHASIASFARFALDLLALGAPAELVAGAHRAALDEVRHARRSFAIAASLGAAAVGPGPLPEALRPLAPSSPDSLLRDTFRDGCIGEAAAALVLSAAARRSERRFSRALAVMAEEEARHAELAWRTVCWLVRTFPAAAEALSVEVGALRGGPVHACARRVSATTRRPGGASRKKLGVWDTADMREARRGVVSELAIPLAEAILGVATRHGSRQGDAGDTERVLRSPCIQNEGLSRTE